MEILFFASDRFCKKNKKLQFCKKAWEDGFIPLREDDNNSHDGYDEGKQRCGDRLRTFIVRYLKASFCCTVIWLAHDKAPCIALNKKKTTIS